MKSLCLKGLWVLDLLTDWWFYMLVLAFVLGYLVNPLYLIFLSLSSFLSPLCICSVYRWGHFFSTRGIIYSIILVKMLSQQWLSFLLFPASQMPLWSLPPMSANLWRRISLRPQVQTKVIISKISLPVYTVHQLLNFYSSFVSWVKLFFILIFHI